MLNRRGFIGSLGAALAGATMDPERAVWVPGRKLISIPKPTLVTSEWNTIGLRLNQFSIGDIVAISGWHKVDPRSRTEMIELHEFVVSAVGQLEPFRTGQTIGALSRHA